MTPAPATIVDLVAERAAQHGSRTAFTFLSDGENPDASISCEALDARARAIAAALQERTAAGDRVFILCPPGLDYIAAFFGCVYAGAIAVPAYPPSTRRHRPGDGRLQAIAADAGVSAVVSTASHLEGIEAMFGQKSVHCLAVDQIPASDGAGWRRPGIGGGTLAFLQYTSGSTSRPKGVMVTHANLLHNQRMIRQACDHTEESVFVSWLPLYHDMGLVGTLLQPLYIGAPCIFMPPAAFLQNPFRWLRAVSEFNARTSGGPNFAYELCVRRVTEEQRASLDLSSWSVAFNGAEPVRSETLDRFAAAFEPCGFRREAFFPCYGLAEASLIVSGRRRRPVPFVTTAADRAARACTSGEAGAGTLAGATIVGCGVGVADTTIRVVDPQTRVACADGRVGEIWVSSPSVARGYWNQPALTEQTFGARLQGDDATTFLRTGDLGLISDEHLFVTGRLQDLIIIRGQNHHPEDIEWTVQQCLSSVQPNSVAAFSVEIAGEERVVVLVECSHTSDADHDALTAAVRRAVAEEHELQVYGVVLLKPTGIPKTSSGKVQRHLCRAAFTTGQVQPIASSFLSSDEPAESPAALDREALASVPEPRRREALTSYLCGYVAQLLKCRRASPDEPLTTMGIDSLTALDVKHRLEAAFDVSIALSDLLGGANISNLADAILADGRTARAGAVPSRESEEVAEYPLSHGQQSLHLIHQLAPESPAYNIGRALRIRGALDVGALQRSFTQLLRRHASLRSTFGVVRGAAVQRPGPLPQTFFEHIDASGWTEAQLQTRLLEAMNAPFDLERGPVFRAAVFATSPGHHVLVVAAHHIVADLWSFGVLLHELGVLYEGEAIGARRTLPELPARYSDYVRSQADTLSGSEGARLGAYWHERLAGDMSGVDLHTDFPRPPAPTYKGAQQRFVVPADLAERVRALARRHGVTTYVVLLAAFQVLLHRYTGQREITLGTLAPGRSRPEFADLVGYFTNPLVLRSSLPDNASFVTLLDETRRTVLDAFDHQDYPFPLLVQQLQPARESGRPPLFQVLFAMQKAPSRYPDALASFALGAGGRLVLTDGLEADVIPLDPGTAQFDLSLFVAESGKQLGGVFECSTDLFLAERMQRFARHYVRVLEAVVETPQRLVADIPLLLPEESARLQAWNDTAAPLPEGSVVESLERQALRTPDAVAVVFGNQHLTYAGLNGRANGLARHLVRMGARPEVPVAICLERSLALVVAIWATLKAGAPYLPLDPEDPSSRLMAVLEETRAPILIAGEAIVGRLDAWRGKSVTPERLTTGFAQQDGGNLDLAVDADTLAYIIYTSGSTGRPKGAMNAHRALFNRIVWMQRAYDLGPDDRVLQKTPATFDVSVWEFTWPLMYGARLVVAAPGGHRDCAYLARVIVEEHITTAHFVPSMLDLFLADPAAAACRTLRRVVSSGEALTPESARRCLSSLGAELHNLYGPTECAIDVSSWSCEPQDAALTIPIGRPIANATLHVLDAALRTMPIGNAGELCIGGTPVGRGYVRRPALTAERFVPDPCGAEPGARLYRTGDVARWRPDGTIEFIGRRDRQVKIRGMRIELGEIEAALREHAAVRQSAVIVREDRPGDKRLVGYVVCDAHDPAPPAQIWASLAQKLPAQMMPAALVALDALPVTAHGKLDVARLPPVDGSRPEWAGMFLAPRTLLETVIARHWAAALSVEQVGVSDNFFEIGGHSLLATQVAWQLQDLFPTRTPILNHFFQSPTVEALAEAIAGDVEPDVDAQRIAANYQLVQTLSENEVEQLIATTEP